jgi:hypothetical protein
VSDRTADVCDEVSHKTDAPAVVLFSCSRERVYCSTGCGRRAAWRCRFELGGKRAGETCGAHLCERCTSASGLCPPHARVRRHPQQKRELLASAQCDQRTLTRWLRGLPMKPTTKQRLDDAAHALGLYKMRGNKPREKRTRG